MARKSITSLTYYFQKVLRLWRITSKKYYVFDVILQKSITSLTYYYEVRPANNFKAAWTILTFFDEAEQSTMALRELSAAFWWCTQWMIQQEYTTILKGSESAMRFPVVAEIRWYFQHVHGFLWGSDDFGGNVMLRIEYRQSALQSCIPWVWKSIPEMLLVGDFIIRAILRCGAPWLWSSGGRPRSAPTAPRHCTTVQYR